jgi:hypothetical protein
MTLDKARALLATQVDFGGGYNRHGAQLILAEVRREHGEDSARVLIREFHLDEIFGFSPSESQ